MKKVIKISFTENEFSSHESSYDGICLSCGEIKMGDVEPDAEHYECESCGKNGVMGISLALISGYVSIKED